MPGSALPPNVPVPVFGLYEALPQNLKSYSPLHYGIDCWNPKTMYPPNPPNVIRDFFLDSAGCFFQYVHGRKPFFVC